jgi:hypothetical protein
MSIAGMPPSRERGARPGPPLADEGAAHEEFANASETAVDPPDKLITRFASSSGDPTAPERPALRGRDEWSREESTTVPGRPKGSPPSRAAARVVAAAAAPIPAAARRPQPAPSAAKVSLSHTFEEDLATLVRKPVVESHTEMVVPALRPPPRLAPPSAPLPGYGDDRTPSPPRPAPVAPPYAPKRKRRSLGLPMAAVASVVAVVVAFAVTWKGAEALALAVPVPPPMSIVFPPLPEMPAPPAVTRGRVVGPRVKAQAGKGRVRKAAIAKRTVRRRR